MSFTVMSGIRPWIARSVEAGVVMWSAVLIGCGAPTAPGPLPPPPPPAGGHDLIFQGALTTMPEMLVWSAETGTIARLLPPGTVAMDPTPSPDGSRIVFNVTDLGGGTSDLFLVNRDGSGLRQLTFSPEIDDQPTWSPAGDRIAFRSFRAGREGDIWVMAADGSGAVNLTPDPLPGVSDERHPAWSPDGSRIAYISNLGGDYDLWVMAADGRSTQRLTATPEFDAEPAWSPDGSVLAYRRSGLNGSDIHLLTLASGAETVLTLAGEQRMPVWAPDGGRLVVVHHVGLSTRPDLYEVGIDGTGFRPLVTDAVPGGSLHPGWLRRP